MNSRYTVNTLQFNFSNYPRDNFYICSHLNIAVYFIIFSLFWRSYETHIFLHLLIWRLFFYSWSTYVFLCFSFVYLQCRLPPSRDALPSLPFFLCSLSSIITYRKIRILESCLNREMVIVNEQFSWEIQMMQNKWSE